MSAGVLKAFQHLSRIFKAYLVMGLLGVLAVFVFAVFSRFPDLGGSVLALGIVLYLGTRMIQPLLRALRVGERPPTYAELMLYTCLPFAERKVVLGDLAEEYRSQIHRMGPGAADLWYWKIVLISIWRLMRLQFRRGLKLSMNYNLKEVLPFYRVNKKTP